MKILENIPGYGAYEPNFEALRLALNYLGEDYSPAYFHGIAGTAFRIGGICPCAPTCTYAMDIKQLIGLLGYEYAEYPYDDNDREGALEKAVAAVRESVDGGVPALVWNAFSYSEMDIVAGYDEAAKTYIGRCAYTWGDYAVKPWDNTFNNAGSHGYMAIVVKGKTGTFDRKAAEIAALKEAVRHGNDTENADKLDGVEWVFLNGKAAYKRWADDFSKPEQKKGLGDCYCLDIYKSTHDLAGTFLLNIAPDYPEIGGKLKEAADCFYKEAECLRNLVPLLGWDAPEEDAERNVKAAAIIREAAGYYGGAIDLLSTEVEEL